jgi:hypothetical protein
MATLTGTHRPFRRWLAAALAAAALAVLWGCTNPFTPAKPPTSSGISVVEDYSTTKKLLDTIAAAMAAKSDGASAYINAFADSTSAGDLYGFHAFHDQAVIDLYNQTAGHNAPADWNKTLERQFFSYFMGVEHPTFSFVLVWDVDHSQINEVEDNSLAVLHRTYSLEATLNNVQETIMVGRCDLYLYKSGPRWYIYRWQDRVDPNIGPNPQVNKDELSWGQRRLESL